MSAQEKLMVIQSKLKVPKTLYNKFGKFYYRNAEGILEAAKPLLREVKATVIVTNDLEIAGDRVYITATALFTDIETGETIPCKALAREEEDKKGMDAAQITGSTSSYARKYALNGLFALDDSKDSDFTSGAEKEALLGEVEVEFIRTKRSLQYCLEQYKVNSLSELQERDLEALLDMLKSYPDAPVKQKEGKNV